MLNFRGLRAKSLLKSIFWVLHHFSCIKKKNLLEFQTLKLSLKKFELKEEKILSSFQSLASKIIKLRPWSFKIRRAIRKKTLNVPNFGTKVWNVESFFSFSHPKLVTKLWCQTLVLKFGAQRVFCFGPSQAWLRAWDG